MNVNFTPRAWYEYTGWQLEDKKILKRINLLIKDIERNGNTGIGKPEPRFYAVKGQIYPHQHYLLVAGSSQHSGLTADVLHGL